jgi:methylated-DNA-[protein]-cysteine S-methyltransferase
MISTTHFDSPLGRMLATAEDNALTGLYFVGQRYYPAATNDWHEDAQAQPFEAMRHQLDEYFAGTRLVFDLPLNPGRKRGKGGKGGTGEKGGTAFQRAVWDAIAAVPFGATTTYSSLAVQCARPSAARASGAATGRNPISLIIPCHRIVGSDGSLTGYAGGLERKRTMLAFEHTVASGQVRPISQFVAADRAALALSAGRPTQAELGLR